LPSRQFFLDFFGWQVEGRSVVFKVALMRTIAKGFILGHATATDAHDLASAETISGPIAIYDLEIPFDSDGTIAIDSDLGGGHLYLCVLAR
jgi:hypothetical protein